MLSSERIDRLEEIVKELQYASQRVVISLEYQEKLLEELKEGVHQLSDIKTEIALLKLKSGWWGAVGGLIAFAALIAMEHFK